MNNVYYLKELHDKGVLELEEYQSALYTYANNITELDIVKNVAIIIIAGYIMECILKNDTNKTISS